MFRATRTLEFVLDVYGLKKVDGDSLILHKASKFLASPKQYHAAETAMMMLDIQFDLDTKEAKQVIATAEKKRKEAYTALVEQVKKNIASIEGGT